MTQSYLVEHDIIKNLICDIIEDNYTIYIAGDTSGVVKRSCFFYPENNNKYLTTYSDEKLICMNSVTRAQLCLDDMLNDMCKEPYINIHTFEYGIYWIIPDNTDPLFYRTIIKYLYFLGALAFLFHYDGQQSEPYILRHPDSLLQSNIDLSSYNFRTDITIRSIAAKFSLKDRLGG